MRVTCETINEFIQCLASETKVFGDTVRVSIIRNPIDGTKREAVKFSVHIKASVVVSSGDSEYLLEAGQACGMDYEDASQERDGSKRAEFLKNEIKEFASSKNWKVLPGVIHE